MDERAGQAPPSPAVAPDPSLRAIDEAGRQLRAPWAAGIAGLLFSIMFTASLLLMRSSPILTADDAELVRLFARGEDTSIVIGGMYLAPFAGIAFLWFVAVIRDQVGEREDRFFATVFLGSGLVFVALLFVVAAVASSVVVGVRYLGQRPPTAAEVALLRSLDYALLFAFATRVAAVFLFSTATIGLRSESFPNWFAWTGYMIGVVLLVVVTIWDWIILTFAAWVGVVSLFILRRERSRRRASIARP